MHDIGSTRPSGTRDGKGVRPPSPPWVQWVIIVTFAVLFVWFMWGPDSLDAEAKQVINTPISAVEDVAATKITVRPKREAILTDPPIITIGTFERTCQECHKLFESPPETTRRLTQHQHIVLNHGLNDRCFNCHDRGNRNRLVLHSGETIPYSEVERLCAKCHGPTYRDWQMQIHGRTDGHWNPEAGWRDKLTCTQCHDPHAPAFGKMSAWPGPRSLRVPPAPHKDEEAAEHLAHENPLRRWEYLQRQPHPPAELPPAEDDPYESGDPESSHEAERGVEHDAEAEELGRGDRDEQADQADQDERDRESGDEEEDG